MDITALAIGLLIPLVGTSLGAATVLFSRKGMSEAVTRVLAGFAVMMALDVALG